MPNLLNIKLDPGINQDKIFNYTPPPEFDFSKLPELTENWISEFNIILSTYNPALLNSLQKHIDSTYTSKDDLIASLKIVFRYLISQLSEKLGCVSKEKRNAILLKLTEGITACPEGFHNRVNEVIASFALPNTFEMLLHLARESLVSQIASGLTDEVHATNTIISLAHHNRLGVRLRNNSDSYYGNLTKSLIEENIKQRFEQEFTPAMIPFLIGDQVRTVLLSHGYVGKKTGYIKEDELEASRYSYDKNECDRIKVVITNLFESSFSSSLFIIEEDTDGIVKYVRDIDWKEIHHAIFKKMISLDFFSENLLINNLFLHLSGHKKVEDSLLPELIEQSFMNGVFRFKLEYIYSPECFKVLFDNEHFLKCTENPYHFKNVMMFLSENDREIYLEKIPFENILKSLYFFNKNLEFFLKLNFKSIKISYRELSIGLINCILYFPSDYLTYYFNKIIFSCFLRKYDDLLIDEILMFFELLYSEEFEEVKSSILSLMIKNSSENVIRILISRLLEENEDRNNWFFKTAFSLKTVSQNNPKKIPLIVNCLSALIVKIPLDLIPNVIKGFLEKKERVDFQEMNGFYWMMSALSLAAEKDPAQIPAIVNCLNALIAKTPVDVISDVIKGLSEKITEANFQGVNGFYWMMSALNWAAEKDPAQIPAIANCLNALIAKTPVDVISDVIKGLSEKITEGNFQGTNGFYWMMSALNLAAEKDPAQIQAIVNCLNAVIAKTPVDVISDVIKSLSEKITKGNFQGTNGFYWLMNTLSLAAEKDPAQMLAIVNCLNALIAKTPVDVISDVIKGLSEKITEGNFQGANGFYWMMSALNLVAEVNPAQIPAIVNCLNALIAKTPVDVISDVIKGLSEKMTRGDVQGENGFYLMMNALSWTAEKNSAQIPTIVNCLNALIAKTSDDVVSDVIKGISEKITEGYFQGVNGFYRMMSALSSVAEKDPAQIPAIVNCLNALIAKTPVDVISDVIKGLSEKITEGNFQGKNGFYFIKSALKIYIAKNDRSYLSSFFHLFLVLSCKNKKMKKEWVDIIFPCKKEFFDYLVEAVAGKFVSDNVMTESCLLIAKQFRKELPSSLKAYLLNMPVADINQLCAAETSLGKLIDYHQDQSKQEKGKTRIRVFVEKLLNQENNRGVFGGFFNATTQEVTSVVSNEDINNKI